MAGSGNGGAGSDSGGTGAGATGSGPASRSEQMAVLDGQLGRGYEEFDGLIIAERARARQQANAAGAGYDEETGGSGQRGDGQGGSGQRDSGQDNGGQDGAGRNGGDRPPMPGAGQAGGGQVIARGESEGEPQPGGSGGSTGGLRGGPSTGENDEEAYPVPDDIPEGRDDDVVARQIREAAMNEPDPELREALWDEYRRYTGLEE